MTFYGESVPLGAAQNITTDVFVNDLRYRSGAVTLPAGETVVAQFYPADTTYLWDDPTASVVVSWVVEVLSGSGTLTLSEGPDPTFDDFEAATPTALGSFAVTGPDTVVAGSVLFDRDYVLGGPDAMNLRIEGSGGDVVLQQVKLRVWPVGGALGGWGVVQDPWLGPYSDVDILVGDATITGAVFGYGAPEDAWDAAWDDFMAQPPPASPIPHSSFGVDGVEVTVRAEAAYNGGPLLYDAGVDGHASSLVVLGPTPGSPIEAGVDDWVPPDEVRGDVTAAALLLGDAGYSFSDYYLEYEVTCDAGDSSPFFGLTCHTEVLAVEAANPSGDSVNWVGPVESGGTGLPSPSAGATLHGNLTLTTFGVGEVMHLSLVSAQRVGSGAPPYPGYFKPPLGSVPLNGITGHVRCGYWDGSEFTPAQVAVAYPAYRVWDPAGVRLTVVRHGVRNDGLFAIGPRRWGQESSFQSGRGGGYQ